MDDAFLLESKSEMDVSRIDPEDVLVDAQNVELADASAEMDEAMLREILEGNEDKVLVSVRYGSSFAFVKQLLPYCVVGAASGRSTCCLILNSTQSQCPYTISLT